MNKKLKTVLSLMLAVMLAMMFSMQVFAVDNADVKAAVERQVTLDSDGNIPQDSALKSYIHPGTIAGGAGDLQLEIGGKPFYIEQSDINTVYSMVSNSGSDDAAVKSDTTDYEILQYKGKWRTVDYIIFDGKQYFLMENQMYGAYTMPMLLNQYGQVIMKECNGSFDSESLEGSGVKSPYILILSFSFSRSSSSLTWNG